MEYAAGGELFYHIERRNKLSYEEVILYIAEISIALNYLHENNIIYRDLKPENILLDSEGHIKLTDFGLAKVLQETEYTSTMCGTVEYLAPEMIQHRSYTKSVDWWELGILTYELLFGQTPFFNQNKSKILNSIVKSQPKFPKNVDPIIKDFILQLLTKEPNKRPDFEQIKVNPFFKNLNFEDAFKKKIIPSYIPKINHKEEVQNFDSEFTKEIAIDSLSQPIFETAVKIDNFSYVGTSFQNNDNNIDDDINQSECYNSCTNPSSLSQLDSFIINNDD